MQNIKKIKRLITIRKDLQRNRRLFKLFLKRNIDVYYFILLIIILVAVYNEDKDLLKFIIKFIFYF